MDSFQIVAAGLAAYLAFSGLAKLFRRSTDQSLPLQRIERKLDLLLKELGVEKKAAIAPSQDVLAAIDSGQTITAIKTLREEVPQISLMDAKNTVEDWTDARERERSLPLAATAPETDGQTLPRPAKAPEQPVDQLPRVRT